MAFLETERMERDEQRKAQLEVVRIMCPNCGVSVVMNHGRGECEICGQDPTETHRTESNGFR